jgi:DNA-binding protein H-NS
MMSSRPQDNQESRMPSIEKATFKELDEMMRKITQRRAELLASRATVAVSKVRSLVKSMGLSLDDIFPHLTKFVPTQKPAPAKAAKATKPVPLAKAASKTPAKKTPKRLAAKYANPKNAKETWSGHGKRPQWFVSAQKAGTEPESMLIKKTAAK